MTRAMLVEDNEAFRDSLKTILSYRYPLMQLIEAGDGKEALRKIDISPPDLVFMDIHLPDENGLELTQMLKTRHPNVVVVILSNYDIQEYRETAYRNGADYFVSKDSSMGDFLSLIEWIIGNGLKS